MVKVVLKYSFFIFLLFCLGSLINKHEVSNAAIDHTYLSSDIGSELHRESNIDLLAGLYELMGRSFTLTAQIDTVDLCDEYSRIDQYRVNICRVLYASQAVKRDIAHCNRNRSIIGHTLHIKGYYLYMPGKLLI